MEPARLLSACVECLQRFRPSTDTVDVHIEKFLGPDPAKAGLPDPDYTFIRQVFAGSVRNEKALHIFLDAFYHVKASALHRADAGLYTVVAYLALFRVKELGWRKFAVLLDSQDAAKMCTFLSFAFDSDLMNKWVLDGWCTFLDRSFIEGKIFKDLDAMRGDAERYLDVNYSKAFGHSTLNTSSLSGIGGSGGGGGGGGGGADGSGTPRGLPPVAKKAPTIPVAPNITQPKPRLIPEPERIPLGIRALPVPSWIEATTLEEVEKKNAALREANKEMVASKYDFSQTVPRLHETRTNLDRVRAEVEARRAEEMRPLAPARRPPLLPSKGADVKLNTAAILREDAVLTAKAAKEAEVIRAYEGNLRDTTEYFAWKEAEQAKDEEARLVAVAARKREAEEAQRAAARGLAMQQDALQKIARDMKAITSLVEEHVKVEAAEEVATRRRVAEQVRAVELVAPAAAKAAVTEHKRALHDKVREASAIAETKLAAVREKEAAERAELIRQIRAIERVPVVHVKTFDPTATSGAGLLEEMGLVELRERLVLVRARDQEEVDQKRRDILRIKREKEELMLARVANITRARQQAAETNRTRIADTRTKKEMDEATAARAREDAMLALSEQLAARRAARDEARRIMEEEEARRVKAALFQGAATAETEARRLESRLQGMERSVRTDQRVALNARDEARRVATKEAAAAEIHDAQRAAEERARDAGRAAHVVEVAKEEHAFRLAETARKKQLFFEATDRKMALQDMTDSLNEYAATSRHQDQEAARSRRGGIPIPVERTETLTRRLARLPDGHPLAATMTMRVTQGAVASASRAAAGNGRGGR